MGSGSECRLQERARTRLQQLQQDAEAQQAAPYAFSKHLLMPLSLFAAFTGRLRRNAPFGAAGDRKVPAPGARKWIFAGLGLKMLEGRWPRSTSSKWRHARLSVRVRKIVTSYRLKLLWPRSSKVRRAGHVDRVAISKLP